jgi:hypothetical protein
MVQKDLPIIIKRLEKKTTEKIILVCRHTFYGIEKRKPVKVKKFSYFFVLIFKKTTMYVKEKEKETNAFPSDEMLD